MAFLLHKTLRAMKSSLGGRSMRAFLIALVMMTLVACGSSDDKKTTTPSSAPNSGSGGSWTLNQKNSFFQSCFSTYQGSGINSYQLSTFCMCWLNAVAAKYPYQNINANMQDVNQLGQTCVNSVPR